MIIITDGESKFPTKTIQEAAQAKRNDITIYAVGVGQSSDAELKSVATTPSHVLQSKNYEELAKQLETLTEKCAGLFVCCLVVVVCCCWVVLLGFFV